MKLGAPDRALPTFEHGENMAIYVDDYLYLATVEIPVGSSRDGSSLVQFIRDNWSHLTADTEDELHQFARSILNLHRRWFEPTTYFASGRFAGLVKARYHYDVGMGFRKVAIDNGAIVLKYASPEWKDIFLPNWVERRGSAARKGHRENRQDVSSV